MSIVRARNWTTGGKPPADFNASLGGRFSLAEQVVGDGQAEQLFVGLGCLPRRLPRSQLPEALEPLPLELEKLAGVVLIDRLQAGAAPPGLITFGFEQPGRPDSENQLGPVPPIKAIAKDWCSKPGRTEQSGRKSSSVEPLKDTIQHRLRIDRIPETGQRRESVQS